MIGKIPIDLYIYYPYHPFWVFRSNFLLVIKPQRNQHLLMKWEIDSIYFQYSSLTPIYFLALRSAFFCALRLALCAMRFSCSELLALYSFIRGLYRGSPTKTIRQERKGLLKK